MKGEKVKMGDRYKTNESENKTELVEKQNNRVAVVIEESPEEAKCIVKSNRHKLYSEWVEWVPDFICEIGCESIEDMKRCREQLVQSFIKIGIVAEDENDIARIMAGGAGVYKHFKVDSTSMDELTRFEKQLTAFKRRHFSDEDRTYGRILIHGELNGSFENWNKYWEKLDQICSDTVYLQILVEEDIQKTKDIDIWLFHV